MKVINAILGFITVAAAIVFIFGEQAPETSFGTYILIKAIAAVVTLLFGWLFFKTDYQTN